MCNSHSNCGSSCSTPASNKNCQTSFRVDDCNRYVPEVPKKCTCCEQTCCKKNNLLHKLCPVPGLRGETMKQVLFTQAIPLCECPPQKCEPVVPKTEMCVETIQRKSTPKDEGNPATRLLVELNAGTDRCCKRVTATQNRQMNTSVKRLRIWYYRLMRGPSRLRTPLVAPNASLASYHWTSDFTNESDSLLSITSNLSIITTKSDVEEVDETIAMKDISNLLKQIKSKAKRPILFHSPFNKDVVWTWRNYDPLADVPKSLEKQQKKQTQRKSEYTPWTMNIVNDLIEGKPVSDKKFRTNSQLQSVVNELAMEIKSGKVHHVKRKMR